MSARQLNLIIPVENGELKPTPSQQSMLSAYLHTRDGKAVAVKLSIPTNTRSQQANRYYWSVPVAIIAEHTGYAPEEVHTVLKDKFLPRKFVKLGNHEVEIRKTTTDLSTQEFETFLEQVRAWASTELGLFIPDPNTKGQML